MKTTEELINEIKQSRNILDFLERNHEELKLKKLPEYLNEWLKIKNTTKARVIDRSQLNKAYVYQIFQGKKYPSRDKIICPTFGFEMTVEETQTLLKQAGYQELYPRDPRDALLLFAIEKKMNILDANFLLYDHNELVLE